MFLLKNDNASLKECGFLKIDINCLCLEFRKMLLDQTEDYLTFNKNEGESILEQILNK